MNDHEAQIRMYADQVGTSEWAQEQNREFERISREAFDGKLPRVEMREMEATPSPQPGKDDGISTTIHQSPLQSSSTESSETTPSAPLIPGAEMPSKMEEAEDLARRMNTTVEQLPEALMAAKEKLEQYAREVGRFSETFKTRPVSRRHRRAQKFGHSRLYG